MPFQVEETKSLRKNVVNLLYHLKVKLISN